MASNPDPLEMEPLDGLDGEDEKFFHPYMAPLRMENTVIDFDIQNLQKLLVENNKNYPVQKIAKSVQDHYMDSSRLIKRAFGKKIEDDFQMYNWGLTLAMDMGLATDKLELLLNVYAKKLPRRITAPDFERIIKEHSNWRKIRDRREKSAKWLDLMASYKIHTYRKEGYPDTIGKRQFHTILDVTEVELDLDVVRLTRDIRRADRYSNKLHMLLLDDPLIKGTFNAEVGQMLQDENPEDSERLRDFQARVAAEEHTYGAIEQAEVDERMRRKYEEKEELEEKRRLQRIEKEVKRKALKQADEDAKQAKLDRLAAIKADREAWEAHKAEVARKAEMDAREAQAKAEREEILRQEREYEDVNSRAIAVAAREAETARLVQEAAVGTASKYAHLSPEERIRAEAVDRLAEHRRQKDLERKRLLEETRKYAESQLALRTARELGSRTHAKAGVDTSFPDDIGGVRQSTSAQVPKKRKTALAAAVLREDELGRGAKDNVPIDVLEKLKRGGARANSATAGAKRGTSPERSRMDPLSSNGEAEVDEKVRTRYELIEKRRMLKEDEELLRVERSRAKLRAEEEARIQQIEIAAKRKEERDLERIERIRREEDSRMEKLEEQLRIKSDREERIAESRALRKLEEERLLVLAAEEKKRKIDGDDIGKDRIDPGERAQLLVMKRKAAAEAKRDAAKARALALQAEQDAKRELLATVLKNKAQQSKKAQAPKRSKKDPTGVVRDPTEEDVTMVELEERLDDDNVAMVSEKDLDAMFPNTLDALEDMKGVHVDDEPDEGRALKEETGVEYLFSESDNLSEDIVTNTHEDTSEDVANKGIADDAVAEVEQSVEDSQSLVDVLEDETDVNDAIAQAEALEAKAAEEAAIETVAMEAVAKEEAAKEAAAAKAAEKEAAAKLQARIEEQLKETLALEAAERNVAAITLAAVEEVVKEEAERTAVAVEAAAKEAAIIEAAVKEAAVKVEAECEAAAIEAAAEHVAAMEAAAIEEAAIKAAAEEVIAMEAADIEAAAFASAVLEKAALEAAAIDEGSVLSDPIPVVFLRDDVRSDVSLDEPSNIEAEEAISLAIEESSISVGRGHVLSAEEQAAQTADALEASQELPGDVVALGDTPRSQLDSPRSSKISLPAFEVLDHDRFSRPATALNMDDIRKMPAIELDCYVPKSKDGTLRLNLREDCDGDNTGIFFHGFKKGSAAEAVPENDRLVIHDEIVSVAGVEVGSLQQVLLALQANDMTAGGLVHIRVRRHHVNLGEILYEGRLPEVETEAPLSPERLHEFGLPASIRNLREYPAEILVIDVPKSEDGGLRVVFTTAIEEGFEHEPLVLSAFLSDSAAFAQGLLRIGDELLSVNHYDIEGGTASDLAHVLATAESVAQHFVTMHVRRHHTSLGAHIAEFQELDTDLYLEDEAPAHIIMDGLVTRPDTIPSMEELRMLPSKSIEILVPKSADGTLRINLRHDDEGDCHGLFIHGFKSNSSAEAQGVVRIGDELLRLDGVDVEGQFLSAVVTVLQAHKSDKIGMVLRRHHDSSLSGLQLNLEGGSSPRGQIQSSRMDMSPRASQPPTPILTARSEHELFQIHDKVVRAADTALAELSLFPAIDIDLVVPKSKDGTLRLYIRHDDEGDAHGLFVHGFKPNCAAERQGLLKPGDELLVVDGSVIKGSYLQDLIGVLQAHVGPVVQMTVRRHLMEETDALLDEMVAHEFAAEKIAMDRLMLEQKMALEKEMEDKIAQAQQELSAAFYNAAEHQDDEEEESPEVIARKAERKKQLDALIAQQKRERQVRMEKEAEERAAKARAMPNSLLSERAIAVAEKSKPWADFDCAVPKTSGELRLHVKHSHKKGLFIHGFKPGSLAEAQGILQQGDEVLEVDGYDVHGKSLQVLVGILKAHTADVVQMRFRRHKYKM